MNLSVDALPMLALVAAVMVVAAKGRSGEPAWGLERQAAGHALVAVGFCLLPLGVDLVVQDTVTTLHIVCALLGVQLLVHGARSMRLGRHQGEEWAMGGAMALAARSSSVIGMLIGLLQFGVFAAWGVHRELHVYLGGIAWHIVHAAVLLLEDFTAGGPRDS